MGNTASSSSVIDGLGTLNIHGLNPPTKASHEKLQQLLRANNVNNSVLYGERGFHNHLCHHLVSAYFLGAEPGQLTDLYDNAGDSMAWNLETPAEVTDDDWSNFIGDRDYERSFFDYYNDKVGDLSFDWCKLVKEFFADKDKRLLKGMAGGLVHTLIHLGLKVSSRFFYSGAISHLALTIGSLDYKDFTAFMDHPDLDVSTVPKTSNIIEILREVRADDSFNGDSKLPLKDAVPDNYGDAKKLAYCFNRLEISTKSFLKSGILLTAGTHRDDSPRFDFFLLHIATGAQGALEIFLSPNNVFSEEDQVEILKSFWVAALLIYIARGRPGFKLERVSEVPLNISIDDTWKEAVDLSLNGPKRYNTHQIKFVRACLYAESLDKDSDLYAKAAVHLTRGLKSYNLVHGYSEYTRSISTLDNSNEAHEELKRDLDVL